MSAYEFLAKQRELRNTSVPECWIIVANSVHSRAEAHDLIATFDTRELAEEYVRASVLPQDWTNEQRHVQNRWRSFRPDSLLWDYNPELFLDGGNNPDSTFAIVRHLRNLNITIEHLPMNPAPPSGPIPMDVFAADAQQRLEPR